MRCTNNLRPFSSLSEAWFVSIQENIESDQISVNGQIYVSDLCSSYNFVSEPALMPHHDVYMSEVVYERL